MHGTICIMESNTIRGILQNQCQILNLEKNSLNLEMKDLKLRLEKVIEDILMIDDLPNAEGDKQALLEDKDDLEIQMEILQEEIDDKIIEINEVLDEIEEEAAE